MYPHKIRSEKRFSPPALLIMTFFMEYIVTTILDLRLHHADRSPKNFNFQRRHHLNSHSLSTKNMNEYSTH